MIRDANTASPTGSALVPPIRRWNCVGHRVLRRAPSSAVRATMPRIVDRFVDNCAMPFAKVPPHPDPWSAEWAA
jgi:hypothetical protein